MDDPFIDRFIDRRDRRVQKLRARGLVVAGKGCAEFLDLCAQTGTVAAVDRIALSILSDAFLG